MEAGSFTTWKGSFDGTLIYVHSSVAVRLAKCKNLVINQGILITFCTLIKS